jgi:hypothetical protein
MLVCCLIDITLLLNKSLFHCFPVLNINNDTWNTLGEILQWCSLRLRNPQYYICTHKRQQGYKLATSQIEPLVLWCASLRTNQTGLTGWFGPFFLGPVPLQRSLTDDRLNTCWVVDMWATVRTGLLVGPDHATGLSQEHFARSGTSLNATGTSLPLVWLVPVHWVRFTLKLGYATGPGVDGPDCCQKSWTSCTWSLEHMFPS